MSETGLNSTERFSDRVENYVKYRPGYPREILALLKEEAGLSSQHLIADLGSGTGILTELFLSNGNVVYGIEPNEKMRQAAEKHLARFPAFRSLNATAEHTTLPSASVDFVTAGQAFHWFDPEATKAEARRILRPNGFVALIWNDRKESDPLSEAYEALLKEFGTDYAEVSAQYRGEEPVREFFPAGAMSVKTFPNEQLLTFEAFRGRLLSVSYAPPPGHPRHQPMLQALQVVFDRNQRDGVVRMEYDTKVFFGRLTQMQK